MHSVTSTECDLSVRAWATNLEDFDMLGKLASGDLFAQDAVYHKECMTKYYTHHRSRLRKKRTEGKISQSELEGIALAETVAYVIEDDSDGLFYTIEPAIHLREQIFDLQQRFDGEFATNAQEDSVPSVLSSFIDMVLCGPSVKRNSNQDNRKSVALAIAQLLIYNVVKKKPTKPVTNIRHRVERETPIAIYIALKVYGATEHCEETINRLHELGICISYARVRDISKVMANSVVKMFEAEGVPCGPTLRNGLLTIGSADNIDLNPTNRDAKDALHGTGCALTQLPTSTNAGTVRSVEQYHEAARALSNIAQLPRFYTEIKKVEVTNESLIVPAMSDSCRPTASICNSSLLLTSDLPELMLQTSIDLPSTGDATFFPSEEEDWITHTQSITEWDHLSNDDTVS